MSTDSQINPRYQSMAEWQTKKINQKRQASRTPGILKQKNCHATTMERYFCRTSRSYKHAEYSAWCGNKILMPGYRIGRNAGLA